MCVLVNSVDIHLAKDYEHIKPSFFRIISVNMLLLAGVP